MVGVCTFWLAEACPPPAGRGGWGWGESADTEFINSVRFRVLRFYNSEVLTEMEGVLEAILGALREELPTP